MGGPQNRTETIKCLGGLRPLLRKFLSRTLCKLSGLFMILALPHFFPPVNSDSTEIHVGLFVLLLATCISFWQVILSRTLSTRIRTVKSFLGLENVIFLFILLSWFTCFLLSFYLQMTFIYQIAILQSIQTLFISIFKFT